MISKMTMMWGLSELNSKKDVAIPIDIGLIEKIDKIIHEPSRLKIIAHLYALEKTDFSYLKIMTDFTWGRLASHLEKLEEAGYIQTEKKFISTGTKGKKKPKTFINITDSGRKEFEKYTKAMKKLFG